MLTSSSCGSRYALGVKLNAMRTSSADSTSTYSVPTMAASVNRLGRTRSATTCTARCESTMADVSPSAKSYTSVPCGAIAPADDALLAQLRRLPVHFQLQLVRFYEPRRLGEPFAELAEEEEKPVRLSCVVVQGSIDRGLRSPSDGAARQRHGGIAIPVLGGRPYRHDQQEERSGPAHRGEI